MHVRTCTQHCMDIVVPLTAALLDIFPVLAAQGTTATVAATPTAMATVNSFPFPVFIVSFPSFLGVLCFNVFNRVSHFAHAHCAVGDI